ncbi:uncharacterized protein LOC128384152 isoform X2 [Scomber japonicus]|uniref:uncharacterized protein LOC128384152 isoform X2 n=1 Tax=Scomber japonicus TaxID=13676 RepID=UPI0023068089|nr:uncharacterized protein LOC128384152 isoform X2 [Scomber japonicus]
MFMLHLSASVLVSLLSLSASAPTADDCSQLVQYMAVDELPKILGKWILIEAFADDDLFKPIYRNIESSWLEFSTTADNQTLLLNTSTRTAPNPHQKDPCITVNLDVTVASGKDLEIYVTDTLSHKFLQTCPDCLIVYQKDKYQIMQLLGRTTTVADSHLETFRKQAACLQLHELPMFHYDTNKELCPE